VAVLEFYNRRSLRYLSRLAAGARRIGAEHDEADISTRWDTPEAVRARLERHLRFERFVGVRIVTPFGGAHSIPGLGGGLRSVERAIARGPLSRFGGFLVAIARKP
jgi:hypothetical protein